MLFRSQVPHEIDTQYLSKCSIISLTLEDYQTATPLRCGSGQPHLYPYIIPFFFNCFSIPPQASSALSCVSACSTPRGISSRLSHHDFVSLRSLHYLCYTPPQSPNPERRNAYYPYGTSQPPLFVIIFLTSPVDLTGIPWPLSSSRVHFKGLLSATSYKMLDIYEIRYISRPHSDCKPNGPTQCPSTLERSVPLDSPLGTGVDLHHFCCEISTITSCKF